MESDAQTREIHKLFELLRENTLLTPSDYVQETAMRIESALAEPIGLLHRLRLALPSGIFWASLALAATITGVVTVSVFYSDFFKHQTNITIEQTPEAKSKLPSSSPISHLPIRSGISSHYASSSDDRQNHVHSSVSLPVAPSITSNFSTARPIQGRSQPDRDPYKKTNADHARPNDPRINTASLVQGGKTETFLVPPRNPVLAPDKNSQVILVWDHPGTPESFFIESTGARDPYEYANIGTVTGSIRQYVVYPSINFNESAGRLLFRVRAVAAGRTSEPSDPVVLDLTEPSTPTRFRSRVSWEGNGDARVSLFWDSIKDYSVFLIESTAGGISFATFASVPGNERSYVFVVPLSAPVRSWLFRIRSKTLVHPSTPSATLLVDLSALSTPRPTASPSPSPSSSSSSSAKTCIDPASVVQYCNLNNNKIQNGSFESNGTGNWSDDWTLQDPSGSGWELQNLTSFSGFPRLNLPGAGNMAAKSDPSGESTPAIENTKSLSPTTHKVGFWALRRSALLPFKIQFKINNDTVDFPIGTEVNCWKYYPGQIQNTSSGVLQILSGPTISDEMIYLDQICVE